MISISRVALITLKSITFGTRHVPTSTLATVENSIFLSSFQYCTRIKDLKTDAEDLKKEQEVEGVPVETSIRYLKSFGYIQTYGGKNVWEQYRRNHKGLLPPIKTRKTCIRKGVISTGNPCPICRDKYLVLDRRNLELLKQFISPQTGRVLNSQKTGLCQRKQQDLVVAVEQTFDYGLLSFDVPFREYDYSEYYKTS